MMYGGRVIIFKINIELNYSVAGVIQPNINTFVVSKHFVFSFIEAHINYLHKNLLIFY